ncbi:MAG: hypothetical protein LC731_01695 [Acidobacteria bacterium]|nr:hypothetical protein [Acidobacteriota bacterium]
MDDQVIRDYQMFVRVRDLTSENIADFPAQSLGRQKFNELEGVIAVLEEQGALKESGRSASRVHTQSKREARNRLLEQVKMISRTARRMALNTTGMKSGFRVPQTNGEQALINAARAFAVDAEPVKSQFIKWEMPETFIEDLNAAIEDFVEAASNKNISASRSTQARAAVKEARSNGKAIVRDLKEIASNKYKNNPAMLAAWKRACHTERAPRASKKAEESTATT